MPSAQLLRTQIEAALAHRIPAALTPAPKLIRPTAPTGITELDERLGGGLPLGSISEMTGPECSGRTSLALSLIAGLTQAGRVCAWVDVSDALDPESAAASGVALERLLWVRCGGELQQLELPGMEGAVGHYSTIASGLQPSFTHSDFNKGSSGGENISFAPRCAEPQRKIRRSREVVDVVAPFRVQAPPAARPGKPWSRLDQALRATDLLLQAGGFSAIVLDMGSVAPEFGLRVPLATWFRYRAAAERTQAAMVLLTQQVCAKSSAGLVLSLTPGEVLMEGGMVMTGAEYRAGIARERRVQESARKPPENVRWHGRTAWGGQR